MIRETNACGGFRRLVCARKRFDMGPIETTAIIRNPADANRFWEGAFLVDTGGDRQRRSPLHLGRRRA